MQQDVTIWKPFCCYFLIYPCFDYKQTLRCTTVWVSEREFGKTERIFIRVKICEQNLLDSREWTVRNWGLHVLPFFFCQQPAQPFDLSFHVTGFENVSCAIMKHLKTWHSSRSYPRLLLPSEIEQKCRTIPLIPACSSLWMKVWVYVQLLTSVEKDRRMF